MFLSIKKIKKILEVENIRKPLRFLFSYMKRYRKIYAGLFAMLFLDIMITLFFAWFLENITDYAVDGNFRKLGFMFLVGMILMVIMGVIQFTDTYLESIAVSRVKRDMRTALFDHVLHLPTRQYESLHSGQLVSHLTNDIDKTEDALGRNLLNLLRLPFISAAIIIYLATLNWRLALLFVPIAPLTIVVGAIFGKLIRSNNRLIQDYVGQIHSLFNDSFAGRMILRSFTLEGIFSKKNRKKSNEMLRVELKIAKLRGWFDVGMSIAGSLGYFLSLGLGAFLVSNGSLSVGSLVAFVSLMQQLIQPLMELARQWGMFQKSLAAVDRMVTLFELPSENHFTVPVYSIQTLQKSIEFQKVTYGYEKDHPFIENLDLCIPAGRVAALVGSSGAGKSTFIKLLHGFYKPDTGRILLDGYPAESLSDEERCRFFAYVPQESYLFKGTIYENIAYGKKEALESDIIAAAKDANAHEFIRALPEGYQTNVGERGARLSGGQKQRIAIARALIKDAPVLLLDEATSALDNETELVVREALERLMNGRTTIVIAHKLSVAQRADYIFVMDHGRICEQGTHEELLSRKGLYERLYGLESQHSFQENKAAIL